MRAIAFDAVGGAEVLHEVELEVPRPGPGQVLIKVEYAGVNFAEVYYRRGSAGQVAGRTVPGLEASGHVVALGEGVTGLAEGDAVAALTHAAAGGTGGYAEYAVAPADLVFPLGAVDLRTGAAFGCVVLTAYGLLAVGRLTEGETVLVHGAAGAVGSVVGRLARVLGAGRLLGTVGTAAKRDTALGYGYDSVHSRERFAETVAAEVGAHGVDIVLDPVAGATRTASLDLLAPAGRLVVFGNTGDLPDVPVSTTDLWLTSRAVVGYSLGTLAAGAPGLLRRHGEAAMRILAAGDVRVDIAQVLPLAEARRAHELLESGATRGKTLLRVGA